MLPMKPGQLDRHTHDYKRNGTMSLFAALEVATGRVTTEARTRHTGADFLAFLRHVEIRAQPAGSVGFVPIAMLWRAENAFAQLGRWRRLARCFEGTTASARAWLEVACMGYLFSRH